MANQNVELKTDLFEEELTDEQLRSVVGGVGIQIRRGTVRFDALGNAYVSLRPEGEEDEEDD